MDTIYQIEITKAGKKYRQSIVSLLQEEGLPVGDLPPSLDNFLVAIENNHVVGAIGLEKYDNCGLLRSMVVNSKFRNFGIASQLVGELESVAGSLGIDCIYLLTETASEYFKRKGYKIIGRNEVLPSIKASSEFNHVCPVSAIVMKKSIIQV